MASGSDPEQRKRRSGRKRLPPVAPGPPLQFVTATHPDDFKADSTMRNVRSHVMYKHHAHDGPQTPKSRPTTPMSSRGKSSTPSKDSRGKTSNRTPQPQNSQFVDPIELFGFEWSRDGPGFVQMYLNDGSPSAEDLHQSLINAILGPCRDFVISSAGPSWMEPIFNSYLAFLRHACVVSVYQDVANRCPEDSAITAYIKSRVIREINERLQNPLTQTDDDTVVTIVHLLVSEMGAVNEEAFDVHLDGIVRIIEQRGGLPRLELEGRTALVLTTAVMNLAIFRARTPHNMYLHYMPTRSEPALRDIPLPESPIYCPSSHLFANSRSPDCSEHTYDILCDMVNLTNLAINHTSSNNNPFQENNVASYEANIHQIYTRVMLRPSAQDANLKLPEDWIYEACRLASLIYCRSLVHRVPISESAKAMHVRSPGDPYAPHETFSYSTDTVLDALINAVDKTDTNDCWRTMPGVFLWICLVGGAAAWPPTTSDSPTMTSPAREWQRKCFALYAMKSSVMIAFEYPNALLQTQRTMLNVQSLIASPVATSPYVELDYAHMGNIQSHVYLPPGDAHTRWEPPHQSLVLPSQRHLQRPIQDMRYAVQRADHEEGIDE